MATINPSSTLSKISGDGSVKILVYTPMTSAASDVSSAFEFAEWADRSVQVFGTFGTGGTVVIEGSNDAGTTYHTLTDPQGNALSFTSAKIEAITEICGLCRARVTAGDGTTSLSVAFCLRRANPMRT